MFKCRYYHLRRLPHILFIDPCTVYGSDIFLSYVCFRFSNLLFQLPLFHCFQAFFLSQSPATSLVSSVICLCLDFFGYFTQWLLSPQIWSQNRAQVPLPQFWVHVPLLSGSPPHLRALFLSCLPSMALSALFSSPFSVLHFPMLHPPFPLRPLLPFSFLPLPFPEGPHTQLEGLASQVL